MSGRLALVLLLLAASAPAQTPTAELRFALVAGRNDGGPGRARLRFAEADAERFADTLVELGGFAPGRVLLLKGPSRAELLASLQMIEARISQARGGGSARALLVVYWSGHAGENGLELGGEHVGFDEVRAVLDRSRAEVRLAFIDACKAGALTAKGAHATSQEFELTVASSPSPDGTAIIASTAPGEDALESLDLRGSFFTHHLTAGLRGPADADRDARITLSEAYRYAYEHTVAQTAQAVGVPQHPTYDLELRGKGDLVLADLSRADGLLSFAAGHPHRWLVVRDGGGGVWEVRSQRDRSQVLALASGRYRLVRADDDDVISGQFEIRDGSRVNAASVPLTTAPYAVVTRKGLFDRDPHALVVQAQLGTGLMRNFGASEALVLGTRHDLSKRLTLLPRLVYGRKNVDDEGFRYEFSSWGVQTVLAVRLPLPGFEAFAGPLAGGASTSQVLLTGKSFGSLDLQLGAAAGVQLPLTRSLFAQVAWEIVGHRFELNGEPALRATAAAMVGLEYSVAP